MLATVPGERLENGPTSIGRKLESTADVELVNTPHEGHVAFADQFAVVHITHVDAFGHCQHQSEIALGNEMAKLMLRAIPVVELGLLPATGPVGANGRLGLMESESGIVVLKEGNLLLGFGQHDR